MAPELKLEGVHFRAWRGDALRAWGEARQVVIRRDTGLASAVDLRVELPARGEPVVVTAPAADGALDRQTFSARGGVVVSRPGERATTDRARYEPGPDGRGRMLGEDPVTVERGALRLRGVGFTFEPRTGELQLGGPVETESTGASR